MRKISKILFTVLSFITLFLSCSKVDDSPTDNPVGGDAYKMQIITIDLPNTTLTNSEYHGSMGNIDITLTKSEDHKLMFVIPSTMQLGNQNLIINDLNNLKITYNVKEYVLTDTADNTIAPFQENLNSFQASLSGNIDTQNAINSFNQIYANASVEDKIKIATIYKANQTLFDTIILNDFSNITGRSNLYNNVVLLILKHKAAVIAMAAGLALTMYGVEPIEKVAGITMLVVAFRKAVGFGQQAVSTVAVASSLVIDDIDGQNNKNQNSNNSSTISLPNDVARNVSIKVKDRTLIASDSNKTEEMTALFFNYFDIINGYVTRVNPVIQWVNNNVPFSNFSLLSPETVPDTSPTVNNPMDSSSFQNLTLSISNPVLRLQNATLTSDGLLNLKVKIVGNATTSVQGTLQYSYSDDLNTFSGTLPITVSNDYVETVTIGSQIWMVKNLDVSTYNDGTPIPQVTDPTQWPNLRTGAWCYYDNDPANGIKYGKLYNWYAVAGIHDNDPTTPNKTLAPNGWHIPSDIEWSSLATFVGGMQVAGGKLKETGLTNWVNPNTGATNEFGFTGLPGGLKGVNSGSLGYGGWWWSSSEYANFNGWFYAMSSDSNELSRNWNEKELGMSVRCIKN
jgi:uncharacterized protein (TIGR02145 family)